MVTSSFHRCTLWQPVLRVLLLACAAYAGMAAAQTDRSMVPAVLGPVAADYWVDTSGKAAADAAQAAFEAHHGRPADPSHVMPFGGGGAVWYRLQFPTVSTPVQAVFTLPVAGLDTVELFRPDGAGGWTAQRSGDALNVDQWPMRYLYPAFGLTLPPGQAGPSYLRIQNSHPIRVVWELQDTGSFIETAKVWHLALGVYAGFMLLVLVLSGVNAASWRDPIHVYYAVHVVLVGLSVLSLTGLAGEYLWPGNARWNNTASILIPAVSLGWAAFFVRQLVAERGRRLLSFSLLALAAYSLLMGLAFVFLDRQTFYRAPGVYAVPVMAVIVVVLAQYSRGHPKIGLWVFSGMAVLVGGSMLALMNNLGWLPFSFIAHYGVQIGAAFEIPLVLVGLYFRSRERRDNRVRFEALSRTDPLTGVGNHRVLVDRLQHLLGRSRRDSILGAVLRVRIANLESIRRLHGREAAEAALVQAARCVTREAAEGDTVAREEGGDLVLVLEGYVTHKHAANAARDIIARGLQFSERLPEGVSLKLRVGGARAPLPHVDAPALLEMLRRAISDLGRDPGRRALRFIDASVHAAAVPAPAVPAQVQAATSNS